jgi:aryl-alcohol dehydrogenase-like predicted oxidoreductase/ferredoxin-NADP reductase
VRYQTLGATGMPVSELALGTANFGDTVDPATATRLLHAALDAGISLVDTADVYAQGRSEEILGAALGPRRDQVVLCTKVGSRVGDTEDALRASLRPGGLDHAARWREGIAPTDRGLSRKHLIAGLEASLRRLRSDYVDLYQLHRFDPLTPIEEVLAALDDLVRSGKVRAVGCSGWAAWQLYRGLWISDTRRLTRFQAQQVPYNILNRAAEDELLPGLDAAGVGVLTFQALAGGLLAGRYLDGAPPAPTTRMGSRAIYQDRFMNARMTAGAQVVMETAAERGTSPTALSIAWVLAHPQITSVLCGFSHEDQLAGAFAAIESPLTPAEADALSDAVHAAMTAPSTTGTQTGYAMTTPRAAQIGHSSIAVVGEEYEAELVVSARTEAADGVVVLELHHPAGALLPPWEPGAHIDLLLGPALVRQYSLCGDPEDRHTWRIGVLREEQSRGGSMYVHESLREGSTVRIQGPRNHFALHPSPAYLFIAGGIGITPILPMIRRAERADADWSLTYGGRRRATMAFLDELASFGGRANVRPEDEFGLLDLDTLLAEARPGTLVYCCGPEPLLAAVEDRCASWPNGSLHVERFTAKPLTEPVLTGSFEIRLEQTGLTLTVPEDKSILDVVNEAGLDALSSCEEGICGTCETAVLEGEPDHRDSVLTNQERARNDCMMICVSRSRCPLLVLDL